MADTLKLYYAKIKNMGDLLNVMIPQQLFGMDVERHSFLSGDMCAIGSCLGQYTLHGSPAMRLQQRVNGILHPKVYIWGTGFIRYDDCLSPFFKKQMEFCALRGELTKRDVERMTKKTLDIPTGDPGLLASLLLDERPETRYEVGIIPHICDISDPAVESLRNSYENSIVIDVRHEPMEVLRQIAACRFVLSGSLHGLIAADSFGIPNHHLVFSDKPLGDGYKFDDYYSAFNVPHVYTDIRSCAVPPLDELRDGYAVSPEAVREKQQLLISSFPFKKGEN